jgi:hydroxymethylpyrimidine/phosphomethylpyrimidine kinase
MGQAARCPVLSRQTWLRGFDLYTSVKRAKEYISGALSYMLDLGHGSGPMNHAFDLHGEFSREVC